MAAVVAEFEAWVSRSSFAKSAMVVGPASLSGKAFGPRFVLVADVLCRGTLLQCFRIALSGFRQAHDPKRHRLPAAFIENSLVGTSPLKHGCEERQILGIERRYVHCSGSLPNRRHLRWLPPEKGAPLHIAKSISEHYCSLHSCVIRRVYHRPGDFDRD